MFPFLDEFYQNLPPESAGWYQAIAEKAVQLGYKPTREKSKHLSIAFRSNRYKATVLKYAYDKFGPEIRLKFFAASQYSGVFERSLKQTIEEFNFKYTGCYGCDKCQDGKLEGYEIVYADGRKYFRCGLELITLVEINAAIKDEILSLLEIQTRYYEQKLSA